MYQPRGLKSKTKNKGSTRVGRTGSVLGTVPLVAV